VLINLATRVVTAWVERPLDWAGVDGGLLGQALTTGVPLVLTTGVVLLLYRFVACPPPEGRRRSAGAIVTPSCCC